VSVEVVGHGVDLLGEGPSWMAASGELLRVDIAAPAIVLRDVEAGTERRRALDRWGGFALPAAGGGIVASVGRDIIALAELDAEPERLGSVEPGSPENRINDAVCDPLGRLWTGTVAPVAGAGTLYRLAGGEVRAMLGGIWQSNGIAFNRDATRMFYVDSPTQRIDAFDYDIDTGTLGPRRTFAAIDPADGLPDGLTVDADGGVWLALYGGGAIRRYTPDGTLDAHVPMPVTNPSSCAFGGADLGDLYVTSTRRRLTPEQLEREPAGSLLRLRPGVFGLTPALFSG
jgi:sugar lactone lactonase YvrE